MMFQKDDSNTIFQLAADLVNYTSQHIFLTGKAGTGKTTFLRYVMEQTKKNAVVVAPTGVAAINAGGVTMHSFFQLPRGVFVPGRANRDGLIGFAEVTDRHSLFKNIHFTSNKRQLLQELELLIIDEVSMMRCDMLDAIDSILRHFRKVPHIPFGGVQVLYIGDLFQLPPVVPNEEWDLMKEYYSSPFFFSAKVVEEAAPLYIELKKIYRQSEQGFIEVLNRIRNNNPSRRDFDFLNDRYNPSFEASDKERFITITTHNRKADAINNERLDMLEGKLFVFRAAIKDEFGDKAFPTEVELRLKVGAQVMFIRNDSSGGRRYFNGKIATIKSIIGEEIKVSAGDGNDDLVLEKETWKNIRYIYNREDDDIDEEVLGSFTQYPIRLAWAITVHKSQGLTFDRAIIDAGAAFAPGQVYVALSRCTSMDGLVLKSRIHPFAISTDGRIIEFAQKEIGDTSVLETILEKEKYRHWGAVLLKSFDWSKVLTALYEWREVIPDKKLPDTQAALQLAQSLITKSKQHADIASKFQKQLHQILAHTREENDTVLLEERMKKAIDFFAGELTSKILAPLQEHISLIRYAGRISKYREELKQLELIIWNQVQKIIGAKYGEVGFDSGVSYEDFDPEKNQRIAPERGRDSKGLSRKTTHELYKQGKTIKEIASLRNMASSTIEGHLAAFVGHGEIEASKLIAENKLETILKIIESEGTTSAGLIKAKLGDEYSFYEIRVAINHFNFSQRESA